MKAWVKAVIGFGIGGGLFAGWSYWNRMQKTFDGLEVISKTYLHKLNLQGLDIRLDLILKNPSKGSFKMKFPFIKILYKDKVIGSSQVVNKDIEIPAHGEARIEKIMIHVQGSSALSTVFNLLAAVQKQEKIQLDIQTKTTVDLGIKQVPFEKTETVLLNQ